MRASPTPDDTRACLVSEALRVAADRREALRRLKADGRAAAGAEALCNGALRHAIRLSVETSQAAARGTRKPLSRRQMDKLIRIISRRRFFDGR